MNTYIFQQINSWAGQNIWLDRLMIFSAHKLGYVLIVLILGAFLIDRNKYRDMAVVSLGSGLVARFGFVALIRYFYYHPRPFLILQEVHLLIAKDMESSFPSGHASFFFALAMGVYLYNKKSGLIFLATAGLIGFARIFVGIHWPLDILTGAVLGIITAIICNELWRRYKDRLSKVL